MKKLLATCLLATILAISCNKSDDPTPVVTDSYMSMSAGSTWNYSFVDNITPSNSNNYTLTSTASDSSAAGKTYHVFANSNGGHEYYNITANDYYRLQVFNLGGADTTLENLYLKSDAAVNANWVQNYNITVMGVPVQVVVTNKIEGTGITKTIGANTYTNVIQVQTSISSPTLATLPGSTLTTAIHYYYAPKVGMIENDSKIDLVVPLLTIDQHTDTKTTLTGSTIL